MRTSSKRRYSVAIWAFAITACLAFALPTHANASCSAATPKAAALGKSVTDIVANGGLSAGQRLSKFRSLFRKNADFPTMARFALGKYWKRLPAGSRKEYFNLVEKIVVNVMFGQLESYAGQKYSIKATRCLPKGSKGKEFYVEGSVHNAAGQTMTSVKWWFLKTGGSLKIFDFQIAGIWLTQQKRAEFTSFLQQRQGKVDTLLADLRRRTGA